jgi:hypothetical protein
MARKKKSQEEPVAIVHTRAIFIKQSEELQKLIAEKRLLVEQANADLANAEEANNVVVSALERLCKKEGDATRGKPRKATEKTAKSFKHKRASRIKLKDALELELKKGGKRTAAELHATMKKSGPALPSEHVQAYVTVWECVNKLVREGKVSRVGRGTYQWNTGGRKVVIKKKVAKKKATKGTPKRGKRRAAWMDPADKFFKLYEALTPTQLQNMMKDNKDAPSRTAVSKYLNRRVKKGTLKRVKRGVYASAK